MNIRPAITVDLEALNNPMHNSTGRPILKINQQCYLMSCSISLDSRRDFLDSILLFESVINTSEASSKVFEKADE